MISVVFRQSSTWQSSYGHVTVKYELLYLSVTDVHPFLDCNKKNMRTLSTFKNTFEYSEGKFLDCNLPSLQRCVCVMLLENTTQWSAGESISREHHSPHILASLRRHWMGDFNDVWAANTHVEFVRGLTGAGEVHLLLRQLGIPLLHVLDPWGGAFLLRRLSGGSRAAIYKRLYGRFFNNSTFVMLDRLPLPLWW